MPVQEARENAHCKMQSTSIHFIIFSGSFVYYLTCVFLNPTSPLGLGGLECGVSLFNPSFFNHSGFNPLGRGLPLPLGSLSEGRAPTPRDALGFLIAFLCHLLRFIFHHFRCRFFVASWLDFASQLGSRNPPNI